VNARGQKYTLLFVFWIFFNLPSRSNSYEWTINTSDSFAQTGYLEEVASRRVNFNLIQIGLQIAERVWLEVAEEHGVFVVLKCVSECCCEVVSRKTACISPDLILEVRDVCTAAMPPYLFFFCFFIAVNGNFHAVVEHGVVLVVVHDVEFDAITFTSVLNTKVKPLSMTLRIDIVLHQTIIFEVRYFLS
jgi:hypothetical protein